MKKIVLLMLIFILFGTTTAFAAEAPWKFNEVQYVCEPNDTLEKIASEYIKKNTYGERDLTEFIQGIIENNDALQYDNEHHLSEGQVIKITYWTAR